MLVLSRKESEWLELKVKVGDREITIEVLVTQIDGSKVRLGIDAPPEVKILRGELVK